MRKRYRYIYDIGDVRLLGNMEQIAKYVGKTVEQLKTERHLTGQPEKNGDYDTVYDFINYKTDLEYLNIPYEQLDSFLKPNEIRRLTANYREGMTFQSGYKITAIKRRPLEVFKW